MGLYRLVFSSLVCLFFPFFVLFSLFFVVGSTTRALVGDRSVRVTIPGLDIEQAVGFQKCAFPDRQMLDFSSLGLTQLIGRFRPFSSHFLPRFSSLAKIGRTSDCGRGAAQDWLALTLGPKP
jgi:hypothetical protein